VRKAILEATEELLATHRFDEITVADVLAAAGVSRASFYFYFESKHAVLAELVRAAVGAGHQAARPWLEHQGGPPPAERLRQGIADGARLWREKAPVLRAIVENWRTDPALTELWTELMESYTVAAAERIARDREAGLAPDGVEAHTLASALTWLGERAYYLAAVGVPPFDDETSLVDVLTDVWVSTVYGRAGGANSGSPSGAGPARSHPGR
jgi:AcrR family transcriptional regulator